MATNVAALGCPRASVDAPDYFFHATELPEGWSIGAHWSQPGASGYVVIAPDGRGALVRERHDLHLVDDGGPFGPCDVSVQEILDGVSAALRGDL